MVARQRRPAEPALDAAGWPQKHAGARRSSSPVAHGSGLWPHSPPRPLAPPSSRPWTTMPPPKPVPRMTPKTTPAPAAGAVGGLRQREAVGVVGQPHRAGRAAARRSALQRPAVEAGRVGVAHQPGVGGAARACRCRPSCRAGRSRPRRRAPARRRRRRWRGSRPAAWRRGGASAPRRPRRARRPRSWCRPGRCRGPAAARSRRGEGLGAAHQPGERVAVRRAAPGARAPGVVVVEPRRPRRRAAARARCSGCRSGTASASRTRGTRRRRRPRALGRHVEHQVLDADAPAGPAGRCPGSIEVIMPGSIAMCGSGMALLMRLRAFVHVEEVADAVAGAVAVVDAGGPQRRARERVEHRRRRAAREARAATARSCPSAPACSRAAARR